MLKKWVLKNKQDLAYAGMKQRLDMFFFLFLFFGLVDLQTKRNSVSGL